MDGGGTWASISDNNTISCHEGMLAVNPHTRELYRGSMSGTYIYPAPTAPAQIRSGLDDMKDNLKLKLYVDRNSQQLNIFGGVDGEQFTIVDITGKMVQQFSCLNTSILGLSKGVYILKSNKHNAEKFIK